MRCAVLCCLVLGCASPPAATDDAPLEFPTTSCAGSVQVPPVVDFGLLSIGEAVTRTITVDNTSDCALTLSVELSASGAFTVAGSPEVIIPSGGEHDLLVTFAPDDINEALGELLLRSDDLPRSVSVSLVGEGSTPALELSSMDHDFGTIAPGCESLLPITLRNIGSEDLTVEGFTFDTASPAMVFDAYETHPTTGAELNGALPWVLAPSGEQVVYVSYAGIAASTDQATLQIRSNDPGSPAKVLLSGAIGAGAARTDSFAYTTVPKIDVVIAVNASASMGARLSDVAAAITGLAEDLDADYRLAVVVQDDGLVAGSADYISPETEDVGAAIAEMLGGTVGTHAESPLTLLEAALAAAGWLRTDAELHLVAVSDTADQSTGRTWSEHLARYQAVDPHVRVHAVGGDYPSGCDSADGFSGAYELVVSTDGTFFSICALAPSTLSPLSSSLSTASPLWLSDEPIAESIAVTVDGAPSTGWYWDERDNRIILDPQPADGAAVVVDYTLRDCP